MVWPNVTVSRSKNLKKERHCVSWPSIQVLKEYNFDLPGILQFFLFYEEEVLEEEFLN